MSPLRVLQVACLVWGLLLVPPRVPTLFSQTPSNTTCDLSASIRHEGNFETGVEGTCVVTVSNVGGGNAEPVIFVDAYMPLGFAFMGGGGAGWESVTSVETLESRNVHGRYSLRLPPGESASFSFTVIPQSFGPGRAVFRVFVIGGFTEVPSPGRTQYEWNLSNNNSYDYVSVFAAPVPGGNRPPIASAGQDLVVAEGAMTVLNGSRSRDPEGQPLSYSWKQISGTGVMLSDTTAATLAFEAPVQGIPILMGFALSVSDGQYVSESATTVAVLPCNTALLPTELTHAAAGGSGSVEVVTASPCRWTAASSTPWLRIVAGWAGTGRGTISYQVGPFSGTGQRNGEIRVGSSSAVVHQSGPPTPVIGQVAAGGGYSSSIAIVNTGTETCEGRVILTTSTGLPFTAKGETGGVARTASTFDVSIPPGGTRLLNLASDDAGRVETGWARFEASTGPTTSACTIRHAASGILDGLAGIPASAPSSGAALPVDIDVASQRYTGFAVANPGDVDITVRVVLRRLDGTVYDSFLTKVLNPLKGRTHVAVFVHQLAPELVSFRGSLSLEVQGGAKAAFAGLVLNRGQLASIPVVSLPGNK